MVHTLKCSSWAKFNYTRLEGTLQGFTSAGYYSMIQVDNNYYHLTNHGSTETGILNYRLTRFDENLNYVASTIFQLCPYDSNIDQMMIYSNNKLIIGAMHEDNYSPPNTPPKPDYTPHIHIYTYNLDLTFAWTNKTLSGPSNYLWGGGVIWDGTNYNIVTFDSFNSNKLYVYKYNSSWDFCLSETIIRG